MQAHLRMHTHTHTHTHTHILLVTKKNEILHLEQHASTLKVIMLRGTSQQRMTNTL